MNRKRKLFFNTFTSLLFQVTTVICGFILPKLILISYGSEVNGLINSINQFLALISFLDLGVGSVVQSSLYKPLAIKDESQISAVVTSAGKFFNKIALALSVYILLLFFVFPFFPNSNFDWKYIDVLIAVIGISSFAQYYFGVVDRLLLTADQRGYIQYTVQIVTLILNTILCYFLIKQGFSIHFVKLSTSLIFLLRPIFLRIYVKKHYRINRKAVYDVEPIKQKWNGMSQYLSSVVLDNTDTVVLTIFSTFSNVSIYSVYHMIVYGVKQLFLSLTTGIQALIGEMWAKQELDQLKDFFGKVEWLIHTGTVFIFGCMGLLIIPFVKLYTIDINDVNYVQVPFAILIVLANACHCLRLPYNIMILAGGHYKQTQHNYIIAAVLNLVISILTVSFWGLIGVAIGTLVAMLYQTVWMAIYVSRNLVKWPIKNFIKQLLIDIITILLVFVIGVFFDFESNGYMVWVLQAVKCSLMLFVAILGLNSVFYFSQVKNMMFLVFKKNR